MNMFDPVALQVVSSKVTQLLFDLQSLQKAQTKVKSKSKSESNVTDEVIMKLADGISSLDGFADELPALILRLQTLANVHQEVRSCALCDLCFLLMMGHAFLFLQATSFTSRLSDLENSVEDLNALSKSNGEVMAALQVFFSVFFSHAILFCTILCSRMASNLT